MREIWNNMLQATPNQHCCARVEFFIDAYHIDINHADRATFDTLLSQVRSLTGARWHPGRMHWTAPRTVVNAVLLRLLKWYDDAPLLEAARQGNAGDLQAAHHHATEQVTYQWPALCITPYQHQYDFANWGKQHKRAMLIGDMGIGKSIAAIMWCREHGVSLQSVLVICPASLIINWQREISGATSITAHVVGGTPARRKAALKEAGIHIVNYEWVVVKDKAGRPCIREDIVNLKKTVVICDESHKMKASNSQRSKAMAKAAQNFTHVLLMTGTPVSQGAEDYFSQFRIISESILGPSFNAFKNRYCNMMQVQGAPRGVSRITGYKNLEELQSIINPYTYTIRKADCLDLPDKSYQTIYVELTPELRKAYHEMKNCMVVELKAASGDAKAEHVIAQNILTRMGKLSQITQGFIIHEDDDQTRHITQLCKTDPNPKLAALEDLIDADHNPVIVVCKYTQDIANVKEMCSKNNWVCGNIDGSVPMDYRQEVVDLFQAGKIRVLVGQVQTMGVGYNLTAASRMVFYSNSYSLIDRLQCEDRIHRIGQKNNCHYIDIVASQTIDTAVINALRDKKDFASQLSSMRVNNLLDLV